MKPLIKIDKQVSRREFYKWMINLIEISLPEDRYLTNVEKEILLHIMDLPKEYHNNRLSMEAKDYIRESMSKERSESGINKTTKISRNYINFTIHSLRSKQYLYENEDKVYVLMPFLDKTIPLNDLEINFNFKINE